MDVGDTVTLVAMSRETGAALFEGEAESSRPSTAIASRHVWSASCRAPRTLPTHRNRSSSSLAAYVETYDVYAPPIAIGVRVEPGRVGEVYDDLAAALPGSTISPSADVAGRIEDGIDVQVLGLIGLAIAVGVAGIAAVWQAVSRLMSAADDDDDAAAALGMTAGQRRLAALRARRAGRRQRRGACRARRHRRRSSGDHGSGGAGRT